MKSAVSRFPGKKAVEHVLREAQRRISTGCLRLYVVSRESGPHRLALICGKRVAKSAVKRNRIRRVVREAIRNVLSEIRQPLDCVAVIQPGISNNIRMQDIMAQVKLLRNINHL